MTQILNRSLRIAYGVSRGGIRSNSKYTSSQTGTGTILFVSPSLRRPEDSPEANKSSQQFQYTHNIHAHITMGFKERKAFDRPGQGGKNKGSRDNKEDDRFDTSKPQFRKPKAKDTKIELDDRFKTVLTDPRFQLQTLDKYGRKLSNDVKRNKEKLGEFYSVKGGKDGDTTQRSKHIDERFTVDDDNPDQSFEKSSESSKPINPEQVDNKAKVDPVSRIAYLTALSRGEVEMSSSDDDDDDDDVLKEDDNDDDSDDDDDDAIGIGQEQPGVLDPSYIEDITNVVDFTTNASPYLAVMNADWTHFRAVDIFAIISSFVPAGAVLRVTVYPSNFGLERLKKEELFGPVDVWKSDKRSSHDDDENFDSEQDQSANDDDPHEGTNNNNEMDFGEDIMFDTTDDINADFDPEKLRLYEASRLKYYFAVVEFTNPQYTDIAYKEVDGMEFEHSSAALDLRIIPVEEISNVIESRKRRDEANGVPSNYNPPDFVVNALQQSTVQCTWDAGDRNREVLLTKYNVSGQTWGQVSETDDLKAYVASDQSSDEEGSVRINKKSSRLRSMLGLESDDDDDINNDDDESENNDSESQELSQTENEDDNDEEYVMETSYIPGKLHKTATFTDEKLDRELTPWERFQEKRQQKKREKRAALREKRKQVNEERKKGSSKVKETKKADDFFVEQSDVNVVDASSPFVKIDTEAEYDGGLVHDRTDDERDFDIRGVQRLEKNKDKKLTGARKRKEERLTGNVRTDFQIDTTDERFTAVLEGSDERFGIDRTDPNFKETPAMKQILSEQTRNRSKRRKLNSDKKQSMDKVPDVNALTMKPTSGSAALSALVSSIKSKVTR